MVVEEAVTPPVVATPVSVVGGRREAFPAAAGVTPAAAMPAGPTAVRRTAEPTAEDMAATAVIAAAMVTAEVSMAEAVFISVSVSAVGAIPTTADTLIMDIPRDTHMIPATLLTPAITRHLRHPRLAPNRTNTATAIRRNRLIRSSNRHTPNSNSHTPNSNSHTRNSRVTIRRRNSSTTAVRG